MSVNLRQGLLRLLTHCGVRPWPRLWYNLRSSAQTDLANRFPAHVVGEWLGNTKAVAQDHYLQVTDDHFREAARNPAKREHAPSRTRHRKHKNRREMYISPRLRAMFGI